MYKYQVTETTPDDKANKFKVFDTEGDARAYFSEYEAPEKVGNIYQAKTVELLEVLYQDGKACTASLVERKYVEGFEKGKKEEEE